MSILENVNTGGKTTQKSEMEKGGKVETLESQHC